MSNTMANLYSKMFSLQSADYWKGLALVVLTVLVGAIQQGLTAHGFDFASYDWSTILKAAGEAGIAYLTKNFFSNQNGQVFGKIG